MSSISLPQMMVKAEFIYPLPSEKQKNHHLPKLRLGGQGLGEPVLGLGGMGQSG